MSVSLHEEEEKEKEEEENRPINRERNSVLCAAFNNGSKQILAYTSIYSICRM